MEGALYWLVSWDGQKHQAGPQRAETIQLATRHGLEHKSEMKLLTLISKNRNLSFLHMLDLAEPFPPPSSLLLQPKN